MNQHGKYPNNLKKLMAARNFKNRELANITGISEQMISKMKAGTVRILAEHAIKLAEALSVTPNDIYQERIIPLVPICGKAVAGDTVKWVMPDAESQTLDYIEYDGHLDYKKLCAVIVEGDSMFPYASDGALAIVRSSPAPIIEFYGKICVVKLKGGDIYIKRIQKSREGYISLVSCNEAYPAFDVSLEDIEWYYKSVCVYDNDEWRTKLWVG